MKRLNITQLEGKEFRVVGFIYKGYEDGYRCCFVTDDYHLIRLPKWYSNRLNNLTLDQLEELKSGDFVLTDIENVKIRDSEHFTTHFKLIKKPWALDNSVPFGMLNF